MSPKTARKRSTACGCERDLGDEHDRALPFAAHDLLEDLQVDERLAAAGDAAEEEGGARCAGEDRVDRGLLRGRRRDRRRRARRTRGEGIAVLPFPLGAREAAFHEGVHHARGDRVPLEEELHRRAAAELFEQLVQRALLRRALEGRVALEERGEFLRDDEQPLRLPFGGGLGGDAERGGEDGATDEAERHDVVVGDPATGREQVGLERRLRVGDVEDGERLAVAEGDAVALADAEADGALPLHRDDDAAPRDERMPRGVGDGVGEGAEERERERDLDESRGGPFTPRVGGGGGVHADGRLARAGGSSYTPSVCIHS
jgi:hypothetical protein